MAADGPWTFPNGPSADFGSWDGPNLFYLSALPGDPAGGRPVVGRRGATLSAEFDRPLDPATIGRDFRVDRASDFDPDAFDPVGDLDYEVLWDPAAPTRLVVRLGEALAPGGYRLVLLGGSGLAGADGAGTDPFEDEQPVGEFRVVAPGVLLAEAVDLGTAGPEPAARLDALDFRADPHAVRLYRVELPAGGPWRLGVSATALAGPDGPPLDAALTLFDAEGRVIATREGGRLGARLENALFAGLPGGVYYVGVSAAGNRPDRPGGYDPAAGVAGELAEWRPGGAFTLAVAADPMPEATRLWGVELASDDPLDPSPTRLVLQFSASVLPSALGPEPYEGLALLDAEGRAWPAWGVSYDEANARLHLALAERLPAGRYRLFVADQGGLVDLSGRAPVGAPGLPDGVLAEFDVAAGPGDRPEGDLGVYLPGRFGAGLERYTRLDPGGSDESSLVIAVPGKYRISGEVRGGTIELVGPDGRVESFAMDDDGVLPGWVLMLDPGTYRIRLLAPAAAEGATRAGWALRFVEFSYDSLLQNGVGQGSALNLRLVRVPDPYAAPPTTSPPPGAGVPVVVAPVVGAPVVGAPAPVLPGVEPPVGGPPAEVPGPAVTPPPVETPLTPPPGVPGPSGPAAGPWGDPGSSPAGPSAEVPSGPAPGPGQGGGGDAPASPAGLMFSFEGMPAGLPSPADGHVAAVGLAGVPGSVAALAALGRGLPGGLGVTQGVRGDVHIGDDGGSHSWTTPTADGGGEPAGTVTPAELDASLARDEAVLAQIDWAARVDAVVAALLGHDAGVAAVAIEPGAEPAIPDELAEAHASRIVSPLGLGVGMFLAVRWRDQIRHWLRKARRRVSPSPSRSAIAGPIGLNRRRRSRV